MKTIGQWLKSRRIDKLMVRRAGLLELMRAGSDCGLTYPGARRSLGEVEEQLRQLGAKP